MQPGFLSVPHYFECDITCRSEKHRSVIESDFKKVDFDNLNYRGWEVVVLVGVVMGRKALQSGRFWYFSFVRSAFDLSMFVVVQ